MAKSAFKDDGRCSCGRTKSDRKASKSERKASKSERKADRLIAGADEQAMRWTQIILRREMSRISW
jgi:hypothetical protein